jgi:hypothetical protein
MSTFVNWSSPDGRSLQFGVYNYAGDWREVSGIYIFCRREPNGGHTPLYIGQTINLRQRIPQHEMWPEAVRLGADSVHVALVSGAQNLDYFERVLIAEFDPILNTHHRPQRGNFLRPGF